MAEVTPRLLTKASELINQHAPKLSCPQLQACTLIIYWYKNDENFNIDEVEEAETIINHAVKTYPIEENILVVEKTTVKMKLTDFAHCAFGMFSKLQCGEQSVYILEPPWNDNLPDLSCIPAGIYTCMRVDRGDDPDAWHVLDVKDRTEIVIHVGNTIDDTEGCPLPGIGLGFHRNKWAVVDSDQALKRINHWLDGVNEFTLYIERKCLNQSYND